MAPGTTAREGMGTRSRVNEAPQRERKAEKAEMLVLETLAGELATAMTDGRRGPKRRRAAAVKLDALWKGVNAASGSMSSDRFGPGKGSGSGTGRNSRGG